MLGGIGRGLPLGRYRRRNPPPDRERTGGRRALALVHGSGSGYMVGLRAFVVMEVTVERPRLLEEARQSLKERLRLLEHERIPRLELEVADSGDPSIVAALQRTREEAARVRHALSVAIPLEEVPHDPTVVELGDTVTVRRAGAAARERFTFVGELEAKLDESWVSVESPLGSAFLGTHIGEAVEVSSPGGSIRYKVLGIERRR